jgi:hypothetical protein
MNNQFYDVQAYTEMIQQFNNNNKFIDALTKCFTSVSYRSSQLHLKK